MLGQNINSTAFIDKRTHWQSSCRCTIEPSRSSKLVLEALKQKKWRGYGLYVWEMIKKMHELHRSTRLKRFDTRMIPGGTVTVALARIVGVLSTNDCSGIFSRNSVVCSVGLIESCFHRKFQYLPKYHNFVIFLLDSGRRWIPVNFYRSCTKRWRVWKREYWVWVCRGKGGGYWPLQTRPRRYCSTCSMRYM